MTKTSMNRGPLPALPACGRGVLQLMTGDEGPQQQAEPGVTEQLWRGAQGVLEGWADD